jgi:hypothetical protein
MARPNNENFLFLYDFFQYRLVLAVAYFQYDFLIFSSTFNYVKFRFVEFSITIVKIHISIL